MSTSVNNEMWVKLRRGLGVWLRALPVAVRHPVATARMFRCQLGSESWNWQFHGDPAPTLLLRQTWQRVN